MQDESQGIGDDIYRESPLSIRQLTPVFGAEVIGATTMAQLKENIGAFEKELSAEARADISKVFHKYRDPTLSIL